MPNPFEVAAAQCSAAVDTIFGERFTFIAMTTADVDAPRTPDSARPSFDVTGSYIEPSKPIYPRAPGPARDDQVQRQVTSHPMVSVDNAGLTWSPVTGDRVLRHKTGETFEIAKPLPDGVRRTIFRLTAKKR